MTAKTLIDNAKDIVTTKYFCFDGRANRAEFWQWVLAVFVINIVLGIVDSIIGKPILQGLFGLAVLLPGLGVTARRLHDRGMSGWMQLLALIPFIGAIIVLVMCIPEGDAGENKYGAAASCGCCCGAAEEKKEE